MNIHNRIQDAIANNVSTKSHSKTDELQDYKGMFALQETMRFILIHCILRGSIATSAAQPLKTKGPIPFII